MATKKKTSPVRVSVSIDPTWFQGLVQEMVDDALIEVESNLKDWTVEDIASVLGEEMEKQVRAQARAAAKALIQQRKK